MSFGNISDFRQIPTGPIMGPQQAKPSQAADSAGQAKLPASGVEGKLSVKQLASLYQSPAPGAPGKAVAGAAKELRNVGRPSDNAASAAERFVRPKQTAAPIASASNSKPAPAPSQLLNPPRPPKTQSLADHPAPANLSQSPKIETTSTPSVKDIAKMFDDIELPGLPEQPSAPQTLPQQKQTVAAQPEFQDINLDIDAEIEQLNTMIKAKEGTTPEEGYFINPSLIQDLDTSAQKQESSKATVDPSKGKEEISDTAPLTDSEIKTLQNTLKNVGVEFDDEIDTSPDQFGGTRMTDEEGVEHIVSDDSPSPPSNAPSPTAGGMEEVHFQAPSQESPPVVTKVSIQGGAETKPLTMQELRDNVEKLKKCKTDDDQLAALSTLQPGQRKQLNQFIQGELALLGQQASKARGSQKAAADQEKMTLLTLAAKVAVHTDTLAPSTNFVGVKFSEQGVSLKTFVQTYPAHMSTNEFFGLMQKGLKGTPEEQKMVADSLKEWVQSGIHMANLKNPETKALLDSLLNQMAQNGSNSIKAMAREIRLNLEDKLSQPQTKAEAKVTVDPNTETNIAAGKATEKDVENVADQFKTTYLSMLREVDTGEIFRGELDKSHKSPTWTAFAKGFENLQTDLSNKINNAQTDTEKRNIANFYARVGKQCLDNGDFASSSAILFGLMKHDKLLNAKGSECYGALMAVLASPLKTTIAVNSFGAGAIPPPSRFSGLIVGLGENPTQTSENQLNSNKLETLAKILRPILSAHQ